MAEIAIVDDEKVLVNSLKVGLRKKGHNVHPFYEARTFIEFIRFNEPDVVFLDLKLPDLDGLDVLHEINRAGKQGSTIIITAHGDIRSAVRCMQAGAYDFISKPFELEQIEILIEKVLSGRRLIKEIEHHRQRAHDRIHLGSIIGQSPPIRELKATIAKLQTIDNTTILIRGESGTGKDLVAKAIHNLSSRADAQFIEVNCAALPENLMECELFGYEKGAFTDARQRKTGLVEIAHGGTLFLDEIAELSLSLQAKLLKFIETKTFRRIGGTSEIVVDLMVVTSTNRNIEQAVANRNFRQDLYYRLNVVPIQVPPLRDRDDDVLAITDYYLDAFCHQFVKPLITLSDEVKETFLKYSWPGNVRELRNLIERLVILSSESYIDVEQLPQQMHAPEAARYAAKGKYDLDQHNLEEILSSFEKEVIHGALQKANGVKSDAARILGISRYALMRRLKRIHL
jgi:two-component system response regulator AtoC